MSNDESHESFSGPWHRKQLLEKGNYIASKDFPVLWKWQRGGGATPSKLVLAGDGDAEDVYCRVVGVVSNDRPFLETHGNFNPMFTPPMHKSRLQFTLTNPNDVDFGPDFNLACKRMGNVQDGIATGPNRSFFLTNGGMCFSFPLWELKGEENSGVEETELTEDYTVRSEYADAKAETQQNYQISIMRVLRWGSDDLVEPAKFSTALLGALVDVTFVFRHHFIKARPDESGAIDRNAYTVFVSEINILKPAPPAVRSPFGNRKVKGALSISQSPRKPAVKPTPSRSEQEEAAEAFGPQSPSTRSIEKRKRTETDVGVASSSKKGKEVAHST